MAFEGRKRPEGNVEEGSREKRRRRRRCRTSSSFIPGFSQTQSARGIVDCIHTLLEQLLNVIESSASTRSNQEMDEMSEDDEEECEASVKSYKLRFVNQIPSTLYSNKQIIGADGKPLEVAIFDDQTNSVINAGPLSSSQIQFFILRGDFAADHHQQEQQISWTTADFDQNILLPRDGKGPLLIGKDLKPFLKEGVSYLRSLVITDNSTWSKTKTFRLGVRVINKDILARFPRIGEALSPPFRVMDQRSQGNQKHHPPRWEDEIWRLDGVGKTGRIINILSSKGINTVGDFLTIYEKLDFSYLRKMLSEVPERIWNLMYCNALEFYHLPAPRSDVHLVQNEGEDLSGNLKVESIDDDDDDLSNEDHTHDQRFDNPFQEALESQVPFFDMHKYLRDNDMRINTTDNVDDGHDHENQFELPNLPCFSSGFEKFLDNIEAEPMQDCDFLRENSPLSTLGEPSTSYNHHINSPCFNIDLCSKVRDSTFFMENGEMGGKTVKGNQEFGGKYHFEVGQVNENLYTSTFSNFVPTSMEHLDLMQLPQTFMQTCLPTLHLDNLPSTSYSYNHKDLTSFPLSFEEHFNENSNDGHGNLNTSNLVTTFSNHTSPPILDDDSFMFPQISLENENYLHLQHSDNLPTASYNHEYLASFPLSHEKKLMWENSDENVKIMLGIENYRLLLLVLSVTRVLERCSLN